MSYNFAAKEARICQMIKNFIYKYPTIFLSTYSSLLGRIGCPEEYWKLQGFVKVVEYFATSSDYLRLSHRFRGDILVGSFVPSYLKAGCFRCWRGWTRLLTNEKTT